MPSRTAGMVVAAALALGGCATPGPAGPAPAPDAASAIAAERIKPFQYLYGSGEAGALSIAAFHALVGLVRQRIAARPADSVVLAEGATLAAPRFAPCADKPFAVVFDVDETVLQNLGFEARAAAGETFSPERWERWEQTGADAVLPVPGAVYAVDALREMGVAVIYNSNRNAAQAEGAAAALAASGLGPAAHGETLFLKGDDDLGSGKDGRRATIASRYCVIAMGGDQLGDFSDLFNASALAPAERRQAATRGWAAQLWGEGWFMIPNPVYGPGLAGDIDAIFPADRRWDDPGDAER